MNRVPRTRFDWARFGLILLAAVAAFGDAIYHSVSGQLGNVWFFVAAGFALVGVAFGTISTNPRVKRFTSWNAGQR